MFADTLTNDTEEHLMHVKEKHLLLMHAFTNACIWDIHISLLAKKIISTGTFQHENSKNEWYF